LRLAAQAGDKIMKSLKPKLAFFLCCSLVLTAAQGVFAYQAAPAALETPQQLQQLVAPIALYPDALVAQILAASTYPDQVVVADRWMQQHKNLKGASLAQQVNKQPWDPGVQALTEYPSVLANMDKNLSWTSSLGDAYLNQQQDVIAAVQLMRQRAQKAGNLGNTPQETVTNQGQTIVVQSADPQVIYVPQYDPWAVYGSPIMAYPGWVPGVVIGGPGISYGSGIGIGFYGGFGWGWNNWGFDWNRHSVTYNHNTYISHGDHRRFYHGGGYFNHGSEFHGGAPVTNPVFHGSHPANTPHVQPGVRPSPFGNPFRGGGFLNSGGFHNTGGIHNSGGSHVTGFHNTGGIRNTGGFRGSGGFHGVGGSHGGGGFQGSGGGFHAGGGSRGGGGHR
jgi:hypothetical protein